MTVQELLDWIEVHNVPMHTQIRIEYRCNGIQNDPAGESFLFTGEVIEYGRKYVPRMFRMEEEINGR